MKIEKNKGGFTVKLSNQLFDKTEGDNSKAASYID
jgi:hypothetical protein